MQVAYTQLQQQTSQQKARMQMKLPELQMTLEAVEALIEKQGSGEELKTDFELTDGVFACASMQVVWNAGVHAPTLQPRLWCRGVGGAARRARCLAVPTRRRTSIRPPRAQDVDTVGLWLGAGVMLDYPLEEAKETLVGATTCGQGCRASRMLRAARLHSVPSAC